MRYCLANKKAMKLHKTAEEMGKVTEPGEHSCNILMRNIFTRLSTKPDFIWNWMITNMLTIMLDKNKSSKLLTLPALFDTGSLINF